MTKYIVKFGSSARVYYTEHHADQFCRALDLNGTPYIRYTV